MSYHSDEVARKVIETFDAFKFSIPENTFTVLAAFLAVSQSDFPNRIFPLSVATGTKCVGMGDLNVDGTIVSDSHAEVLARRALKRYLLQLIICCCRDPVELENPNCIIEEFFVPNSANRRFRVKSNYKIAMYISDSPCGDCTIYNRNFKSTYIVGDDNNKSEPLIRPKYTSNSDVVNHGKTSTVFTGAKIVVNNRTIRENSVEQTLGLLRVRT